MLESAAPPEHPLPPCRILAWEVTRACNLACRHCRASAQDCPHPDELSTAEGLAFIDELSGLETPPMLIFTGGEPLLRADIYDLADHARKRGVKAVMAPNGTLLDTRAAARLMYWCWAMPLLRKKKPGRHWPACAPGSLAGSATPPGCCWLGWPLCSAPPCG